LSYYLDTNICIFFLRGTHSALLHAILSRNYNTIKIPSIVAAELIHGAEKSLDSARNMEYVKKFLMPFEIAPFDILAAYSYGKIRSSLEKRGQIIGPNDLIIAATVLSQNGILITNNINEFARVENLAIEDWTK
jgi:tRNA(fMet)-specific endonuclease VapC